MEVSARYRGRGEQPVEKALSLAADEIISYRALIAAEIKQALYDYLKSVAEEVARRHSAAWPGGTTDKTMSKRTGGGVQSILDSVSVTGGGEIGKLQGKIGGASYLRIHEYGGTIRVKRAKYLTIPLPAALDSRGVPKKPSARDWQNTFVQRSRNGNLIIFQKNGPRIIPLYVLKEEVKIPARLGLREELNEQIPVLTRKIERALLGRWGNE